MRAAIVDQFGQAPRYGEFEDPVPGSGEELVEVTAAGIKQLDRAIVSGTHYSSPRQLPVVPGTDGVGRTGNGTRVYFAANRRPFGGMAERAPASWTVPLPAGLDDALAAAIVNPAFGAWLPLVWRGRMQAGETVMVLGATGATGRLAVRAARLLGAGRIIAGGRNTAVLNSLGADQVIDLSLPPDALKEAFSAEIARGVDLVVDYVWGPVAEAFIAGLVQSDLHAAERESEIRLVSVGAMAGANITLPSAVLRGSRLTILGSGTANFPPVPTMQALVADILRRAAAGELSMEIETMPLAAIGEAWPLSGQRRIVLIP